MRRALADYDYGRQAARRRVPCGSAIREFVQSEAKKLGWAWSTRAGLERPARL